MFWLCVSFYTKCAQNIRIKFVYFLSFLLSVDTVDSISSGQFINQVFLILFFKEHLFYSENGQILNLGERKIFRNPIGDLLIQLILKSPINNRLHREATYSEQKITDDLILLNILYLDEHLNKSENPALFLFSPCKQH